MKQTAGTARQLPGSWAWRAGVSVAALALATGVGFSSTALVTGGHPAVSSAIPSPAKGDDAFVEDDNLTAQDNQSNILAVTAPGLVHIMSGGVSAGIGMVLTASGKVLTSTQAVQGMRDLKARYVMSGATFGVKLIGTNTASGLALVQMEGGGGRAFSTVKVGNSATLASSAYDSRQFSYHLEGEVMDTAVGTTGTGDNVTLDVGTLTSLDASVAVSGVNQTGLMASVMQSSPDDSAIGGPLVDLNGEVIGVTVAGAGTGLRITAYALPVNRVLAIASQIDRDAATHSGLSLMAGPSAWRLT